MTVRTHLHFLLFLGLVWFFNAAALAQPCSLNDVSISPQDSSFCGLPASMEVEAVIDADTTPILLATQYSSVDFQDPFDFSLLTNGNGCYYVLKISGLFTLWDDTDDFYDGQYLFDTLTNEVVSAGLPGNLSISTPDFVWPDTFSLDHEYFLFYEGNGQSVAVEYTDDNYPDNGGSLTFEWMVIPCYSYSWTINGSDAGADTTATLTASSIGMQDVSVTVTDIINQCDLSANMSYPVHPLPAFSIATSGTCPGFANGQAEATLTVGQEPVIFDWSTPGAVDAVASALDTGMYALTITDANGCIDSSTFEIIELPAPLIDMVNTTASCPDDDTGSAQAVVMADLPPVQFSWSSGDDTTEPEISELATGDYSLTITDGNGCRDTAIFVISEQPAPQVELEVIPEICPGAEDGQLNIQNPDPGWVFSLDGENFQTQANFTGLDGGDKTLYLESTQGCIFEFMTSIPSANPILFRLPDVFELPLGENLPLDGTVQNIGNYQYAWSPGDGLDCTDCPIPHVNIGETTTYTLSVSDDMGCSATDTVRVEVIPVEEKVFIPNAISPDGNGINDKLTVYGGDYIQIVRTMRVFNRWGGLIYEGRDFEANDPEKGWDGTFEGEYVKPGVYVVLFELEFADGRLKVYEGDVLVLK